MRSKRLNLTIAHNKKQKFKVLVTAVALCILSFGAGTFASYVYSAIMKTYVVTAEDDFYFTSDLLTDAATVPVYHITHDWLTPAVISFKLKNYENQLNISDRQITYSVTASPGNSMNGEIDPGPAGQSQTVSLTVPVPANPGAPQEVLVTATSNYPIVKTLKARFIISPAVFCTMTENANSPVAGLTITVAPSTEPARPVAITWQEGAAPDMTSPIVRNATSIDLANKTLTTSLNTAASYELIFFKDSPSDNYTGVTASGV